MLFWIYRLSTYPLWFIFLPWLYLRTKARGDSVCFAERMGRASKTRPHGVLIWLHAVSFGEAQSLLPLIARIFDNDDAIHILLTTGTPSSAAHIKSQQRHPSYQRLIHQYLPYDHPFFVERFLTHWRPDVGLLVESELWPNLITHAGKMTRLVLLNARISNRSFRRWQNIFIIGLIRHMLAQFELILAQDSTNASRLIALGATHVETAGNLKLSAPPLPADNNALRVMRRACINRIVWLAASTHEGEEKIIAEVHARLKPRFPTLLSIIVPRHPQRGNDLARTLLLNELVVAQRSHDNKITDATDIYLADSFGELGLFYRLCPISLIGGSLIKHGGQNPLEAARLESVILHGAYIHNFAAIFDRLRAHDASLIVENADDLMRELSVLFTTPEHATRLRENARKIIEGFDDSCTRCYELIRPLWHAKSRARHS